MDGYVYGSLWNCEPPRSFELPDYSMEQAPVERSFRIHVIASYRWRNFDEYLCAVSDSIRYEYRKAVSLGSLRTEVWRGWRALRCLPEIMECRRAVIRKLGERFVDRRPAVVEAIRLAGKLLLFGQRSFVALALTRDGDCLSAFVGIEFGNRIYHIMGGTKPNRMGAGTLLMLNTIKPLFENQGNGELILGACWGDTPVEDYRTGTLLYRRKLRVEAVNAIYQRILIRNAEAVSQTSFVTLLFRYLQPWIPFAGLVASGLAMEF